MDGFCDRRVSLSPHSSVVEDSLLAQTLASRGISFAGAPTTVAIAATSRVTTDPAPTMARSPMVTPGRSTQ